MGYEKSIASAMLFSCPYGPSIHWGAFPPNPLPSLRSDRYAGDALFVVPFRARSNFSQRPLKKERFTEASENRIFINDLLSFQVDLNVVLSGGCFA